MFVHVDVALTKLGTFDSIDLDMKKDIDTLIAEERAEIISKYERVRQRTVAQSTFMFMGVCVRPGLWLH